MWGSKLADDGPEEKRKSVDALCAKYSTDFDVERFRKEIMYLSSAVQPFLLSNTRQFEIRPIQILDILVANNMQGQFENCFTALIMYLTFPVTVASNERAFSKLKIIKNQI